ncbi:hypothetical protein [Paenibacillus radicis (ex Gao et al. 2016)]|uniref:Uncharacterized protein n=1 Tax=Paenibacillus radicis (ex Gao et al. 2016) TaxID=1737354 RepID=A0A917GTA3_9BACL|nr:hypothetical protein [Paenibacillus radicis (ex Gao et al. 2016)]GGG56605.1 hypothetical protein GCM10010918_06970 [Paenibacillus radicis (ex Gao et al. 2016)]
MLWTAIWFFINILFVVSLIMFLFVQRSVSEAAANTNEPDKLRRAKQRRNVTAIVSIALLVAMSASFLINMRLNG